MKSIAPMAVVALVGLGSMVLAASQAPVPAASEFNSTTQPDTVLQPGIVPIKIELDAADGINGLCSPDPLRLPADTDVDLQLDNRGMTEVSFSAPVFFSANRVIDRDGGEVMETSGGSLLLSVPPGGTTSVRLRTTQQGEFDYKCFLRARPGETFDGSILVMNAEK